MRNFSGTGAGSGIAIGVAHLLPSRIHIAERRIPKEQIEQELDRFKEAVARTDSDMARIGRGCRGLREVGTDLVDTHRAMLKSSSIAEEAMRIIRERGLGAESAVRQVVEQMRSLFARIEDERFRARLGDVEAVAEHLLRSLLGAPEPQFDERLCGAIAVGVELSPLDALKLHQSGIAGFATERGGPTSHETIIARTLGIPYAFGVKGLVVRVRRGELVCIDAARGKVSVRPDASALRAIQEQRLIRASASHALTPRTLDPDGDKRTRGVRSASVAG